MNEYIPFAAEVLAVIKHTELEYTFRMAYHGAVKPGQFFQISLPKYGEAPISVSGIGAFYIDFTIRRVGKVTNEIFENYVGDHLFMRGPYGNGFELEAFKEKELIIVAGGTGVSPVKGVVDYFAKHPGQARQVTVIAGFKSPQDLLFREEQELWKRKLNFILTVDDAMGQTDYQTGLVTKYIPDLDIKEPEHANAIVVGPPVMMKFSVQELLKRGLTEQQIYVSYERKMCCGIGKCGHCKIDDTYICLDGPVFRYAKGKLLVD